MKVHPTGLSSKLDMEDIRKRRIKDGTKVWPEDLKRMECHHWSEGKLWIKRVLEMLNLKCLLDISLKMLSKQLYMSLEFGRNKYGSSQDADSISNQETRTQK